MAETITNPCAVCLRDVTSRHYGALCKGDCGRWFHKDCAKISTAEYSKLSSDENKNTWSCRRVDCSKTPVNLPNPTPLLSEMQKLTALVNDLVSKVDTIKTKELTEIKNDVKYVGTKLERVEGCLLVSETKINKLDDEVNQINSGIEKLRSSIDVRLSNIESRVDEFETKLKTLEERDSSASLDFEEVIGEMSDRNRRALNVILYNLPECKSTDVTARINSDKGLLLELAQTIGFDLNTDNIKINKIGKFSKNKVRPTKVTFKTITQVSSFLDSFAKANLKENNGTFSNVGISRDRTERERRLLSSLREQIQQRTQEGEQNLTIKFKNGVPAIVSKPKNE